MDKTESIIDRLNLFVEESGLTRAQFADACGIPRPTISQMLSGKNKKIGDDIISIVHKTYPEIPMLWLLFGEGVKPVFKGSAKVYKISSFENNLLEGDENVNQNASSESMIKHMVNKNSTQKKISKIVVFFTDNSFEEYILKE